MKKVLLLILIVPFIHATRNTVPYSQIQWAYRMQNAWGLHTSLDLKHCDPEKIRSEKTLKTYFKQLCSAVGVFSLDDPIVKHVGDTEKSSGYAITLHTGTTTITGRVINAHDSLHIDIIKDAIYDPNPLSTFTQTFFQTQHCVLNITLRA